MTEEESSVSGAIEEAAAPVPTETVDQQPEQAERQVPLSALESERSQRQQAQDDLKMLRENLNLMQMRQQQSPQPPSEPIINDDDVMTFGDFKKAAGKIESQIRGTLSEMQMSKTHSDYDEVVRKYLPQIVREDPEIGHTLRQTQDFRMAYRLAKTSDEYRQDHQQKKMSTDAQRVLANSEQSGNLSSVGGTSPISMVRRYKDMSDNDFRKEMAKNVGYV